MVLSKTIAFSARPGKHFCFLANQFGKRHNHRVMKLPLIRYNEVEQENTNLKAQQETPMSIVITKPDMIKTSEGFGGPIQILLLLHCRACRREFAMETYAIDEWRVYCYTTVSSLLVAFFLGIVR